MIGKLLDFLFGKNPDIFDAKGAVLHKFPPEKWQAWKDRFQKRDYDWRQHRGTERKISAIKADTPPPKEAKAEAPAATPKLEFSANGPAGKSVN